MPEGQLTNLTLDPITGGIITPGVLVNDDFEVNRLANYIDSSYWRVGSKQYATIQDGRLYNKTLNTVNIRNNRKFLWGNSLISYDTGSTDWLVSLFPKIIDNNNFILLQTYSNLGIIAVYINRNNVYTRADANDILGPVTGDGAEIWVVCRIGKYKTQTKLTVQTYQSPPWMFFPPYQVRDYLIDQVYGSFEGYAGVLLDGAGTIQPTASLGEWIVTDDTVKTTF
jgi:hypothetical protein